MNRFDYWVWGYFVRYLVLIALMVLTGLLAGLVDWAANLLALGWGIVVLWSELAVTVKRAHDLDHSGWWVLWSFVPFMNIWVWVSVSFLAGTPGPNRFGPPASRAHD